MGNKTNEMRRRREQPIPRAEGRVHAVVALLFLVLVPAFAAAGLHFGENHPDASWKVIETEHFRVIHPEAHRRTAERTGAIAEEAFLPVTDLVGGAPPGRIDILLRDWDDASGGRSWSGWPRMEIEPYPLDREVESIDFLRQLIVHEFTHVAMYYAIGGARLEPVRAPLALLNIPDWWVEGLASAMEKPGSEPRDQDLVHLLAASGELPSRNRLDDVDQGDRLDNSLIYRIGESKVRWFADRFGVGAIAAVHRAMRPVPWSFDRALREATGMGEGEIHRAWLADMEAACPGEGEPPRPESAHPLPRWMERPVTFAFSSRGDLAVVAVRDEDVWWPELYLQKAGEREPVLIDANPVWSKLTWSDDGSRLAWSRRVAGRSNSAEHDLYVYTVDTGKKIRLTRGRRAVEPAWKPGSDTLFAVGYDDKTGASLLLSVSGAGGDVGVIPVPEEIGSIDGLAPSNDSLLYFTAVSATGGRNTGSVLLGGGLPRFRSDRARSLYDPVWHDREGLIAVSYENGSPRLVRPFATAGGGAPECAALPLYVRHVAPGPEDGLFAVTADSRYRSAITRIDTDAAPGDPDGERIAWHSTGLIEPPAPGMDGAGRFPISPYRSVLEIRPRPIASIETINTDRVDFVIKDLLADPADRHNLRLHGGTGYDGDRRDGFATYRNRRFLPTLFLQGGYGESKGKTGGVPWEVTSKTAATSFRLPFRADAYHTWYRLSGGLIHDRSERVEETGLSSQSRETLADLRFEREVSRPRRRTSVAVGYERGVDLFHPDLLPERWTWEGIFSNAVFRNDWFLSLVGSAAVESGMEKREITLYPSLIADPSRAATGTRAAVAGAGFSFPWSEDMGRTIGPFYMERLTQKIAWREGRAWSDDGREEIVRSITAELDLALFSARFLPFFGTGTTHFRVGVAREMYDRGETEIYFAIDSDWWNERWPDNSPSLRSRSASGERR